jgi:hypothetical protein
MGNEHISLSILPERGGKIVSLFDRRARREWLVAPERELGGPADASIPYDEGDLCGWDEMMPTIAACRYPQSRRDLPDHGELWQKSWRVVAQSEDSLVTSVTGDLGYQLEREIHLGTRGVRVDYLVGAGCDGLEFLWAAHPFFALRSGTRMKFEGFGDFVGDQGDEVAPHGPWPTDEPTIADILAPGLDRKVFAPALAQRVSASLHDPSGAWVRCEWESSDAPWLGLWLDRASLSSHQTAVIEPTGASSDSLEVAARLGQSWKLAPGESRRWSIAIECGVREGAKSEEEKGKL